MLSHSTDKKQGLSKCIESPFSLVCNADREEVRMQTPSQKHSIRPRPPSDRQKKRGRIFCYSSWVGVVLGVRVIRGRYGLVARCKKKDP